MKIIILIKQIPDTNDVKLDPKTGNLNRTGIKTRLNPADANVIEAALQIRNKHGGSVTAISMGPPQAKNVLMKSLALGCDDAYLLSDRAFGGADTLATAYTLSLAVEKIGKYDLVLTGSNSDDGDTAQIGAAVAAFLDIPQVTFASSIDVSDKWAYCDRTNEQSVEKVRVKLPAVVTLCKGCNSPQYALPGNILSAESKPFTTWDSKSLNADMEMIGMVGSPSSTKKVFEPPKIKLQTQYFEGSTKKLTNEIINALYAEQVL